MRSYCRLRMIDDRRVIVTCFAGRRENLEILLPLLDRLRQAGHVDEVHLWDFTRRAEDARWLRARYPTAEHAVRIAAPRPVVRGCHTSTAALLKRTLPAPQIVSIAVEQPAPVAVMPVCDKLSWTEYYRHYTPERFPRSVVVKMDDDIAFLDVAGFPGFVRTKIRRRQDLLAFASIINNGVCAHHQQRAGLLPVADVGIMPYEPLGGKLWGSGAVAQRLHEYFLDNADEFVEKSRGLRDAVMPHPAGQRLSINFFAILSEDLGLFRAVGRDDELDLTVTLPPRFGRAHYVDMSMVVSHLGFWKQRDTGLDEAALRPRYAQLGAAGNTA